MSILGTGTSGAISAGLTQTIQKGVVSLASNPTLNKVVPKVVNMLTNNADPTSRIQGNQVVSKVQFPNDLPKYYMAMKFHEYTRPSVFANTQIDTTDFIALPMPTSGLNDTYNMGYDDKAIHGAAGYAAEQITNASQGRNTIGALPQDIQNALSNIPGVSSLPNFAQNGGNALVNGAAASLIAQAQGNDTGLGAAGLQILGIAENPYLTVLFTGPQFKVHRFRWLLSPKTASESGNLTKIINTFKKGMHPELVAGTGAFKIPRVLEAQFKPDAAAVHMYTFKPMVITSCDVNYTPIAGGMSWFAGTMAPVALELSMEFKEIQIWTQADFNSDLVSASSTSVSNTATQALASIGNVLSGPPNAAPTGQN